ncbi:YncE family protein [Geomicrobium sp. JCM 19039]|uniref:YncE family protein n=1 Tax=Geomicrobium sp. JCM 19039 TaxID=1460636 RepID=UPI00045F204C|nr:hypothetical protein [Geomicrobium sp. JCM 19039]GAK14147.1 FOG protein containing WD40-like repeat [Geomicrobium sp. JCM 19039]
MSENIIIRRVEAPGKHLCGLSWDGKRIWHSDGKENYIYSLMNNQFIEQIKMTNIRTDLTVHGNRIFQIAGLHKKEICVLTKTEGKLLTKLRLDRHDGLCGMEYYNEGLWLGYKDPGEIIYYSLRENKVMDRYYVNKNIAGLTYDSDNEIVVFADFDESSINFFQLNTCKLMTEELDFQATGLTFDGENFWIADFFNHEVKVLNGKYYIEKCKKFFYDNE